MVHTSHRGKMLVAYDRKSPRHNWNMFCTALPGERAHLDRVVAHMAQRIPKQTGWEQYQQMVAVVNITDGIIPDNLPKNASVELADE